MKKPTLTILVPAHNEEGNIKTLLESILRQRQRFHHLVQVTVLCDGCTDGTAALARAIARREPRVRIVDDGKRLGKNKRLAQAFKKITSDLTGIFDADMMLSHSEVLDRMVRRFSDADTAIVGANNIPVPDSGLQYRLITIWTNFWYRIKLRVNNGNNIHNVRSCCLMLRTWFVGSLTFPDKLLSFGQYVYLAALARNSSFRFEKEAVVYYRIPVTVADYAIQKKRVKNERDRLARIFGSWVHDEYRIPASSKAWTVLYLVARHPVITGISVAFKAFLAIYIKNKAYSMKGNLWSAAATTKRGMDMSLFDGSRDYLWR